MLGQGPGLLRVPGMCFAHSSSQQIRTLRLDAYVDNLTLERMLVYLFYNGVLTAAPYRLLCHCCAAACGVGGLWTRIVAA